MKLLFAIVIFLAAIFAVFVYFSRWGKENFTYKGKVAFLLTLLVISWTYLLTILFP